MAHRLYIASDQLMVFHLYTVLEAAGISVLTQKAAVDVPQAQGAPLVWHSELWLLHEGQLAAARRLLELFLSSEAPDDLPADPQVTSQVISQDASQAVSQIARQVDAPDRLAPSRRSCPAPSAAGAATSIANLT
ncbi:hypothetical protein Maes01_01573 [Microbulbifer aestuariivivens]|uniref:DUF2007 domain-containing protein n=2 Tax=Microbulbifer aestuariivivens TaxID=1908308 RepID=A0ABP9WQZ6_9GAMM